MMTLFIIILFISSIIQGSHSFTPLLQTLKANTHDSKVISQRKVLRSSLYDELTSSSTDINRTSITLPIFPLRKQVKFPTDYIYLNLYEKRYLSLATYMFNNRISDIRNKRRDKEDVKILFGALYCSHKAQMVLNGVSPITPIVDVGDVGAICQVIDFYVVDRDDEDEMQSIVLSSKINNSILDSSKGDDIFYYKDETYNPDSKIAKSDFLQLKEEKLQKIKLRALVIGRFKVDDIVQNGFGGGNSDDLPFIVVKASHIFDHTSLPAENTEEEKKCIKNIERLITKHIHRRKVSIDDDNTNNNEDYDIAIPSSPNEYKQEGLEIYDMFDSDTSDIDKKQIQIWSFAIASSLVPLLSEKEMLYLLSTTSTNERLHFMYKFLSRTYEWFSV